MSGGQGHRIAIRVPTIAFAIRSEGHAISFQSVRSMHCWAASEPYTITGCFSCPPVTLLLLRPTRAGALTAVLEAPVKGCLRETGGAQAGVGKVGSLSGADLTLPPAAVSSVPLDGRTDAVACGHGWAAINVLHKAIQNTTSHPLPLSYSHI